MIHNGLLGSTAGKAEVFDTFNPLDLSDYGLGRTVTLSNNNLTASVQGGGGEDVNVRAILGRTTGKHYVEFILDSTSGGGQLAYGIASPSISIDTRWSTSVEMVAFYPENANLYQNGVVATSAVGGDVGDVFGFNIDIDNQLISVSINDIERITDYDFSAMVSGEVKLFCGNDTTAGPHVATMRTDPSQQSGTPKAGYTAGW